MGIIIGPPLVIHAGGGGGKAVQYLDPSEAEYVFRASGGGASIGSGKAKIDKLKGRSLVWNQLVQNGDFSDGVNNWASSGADKAASNGVLTLTMKNTLAAASCIQQSLNTVTNHKYLVHFEIKPEKATTGRVGISSNGELYPNQRFSAGVWNKYAEIRQVQSTGGSLIYFYFNIYESLSEGDTLQYRDLYLIDLTLMFGAGNEPATVEEFEEMFPLPYYDYNAGEIISNKTEAVEVTGFNLANPEDLVAGGLIRNGNDYVADVSQGTVGGKVIWANKYHCPGIICISFHKKQASTSSIGYYFQLYHTDGSRITAGYNSAENDYLELSDSGKVVDKIVINNSSSIVTTFSNLIINLSDPARNGQYEPYKTNTIELNLPTLTGKLNGEGESVVVFQDGLKSAGNVYDEIVGNKAIKRIGVVDMGSLNWSKGPGPRLTVPGFAQSVGAMVPLSDVSANAINVKYIAVPGNINFDSADKMLAIIVTGGLYIADTSYSDAVTFKTAMNGVMLYYELAEPEEYILDAPIPKKYKVWSGGTEERLPKDTSSVVNAPVRYDVLYPEPKD